MGVVLLRVGEVALSSKHIIWRVFSAGDKASVVEIHNTTDNQPTIDRAASRPLSVVQNLHTCN